MADPQKLILMVHRTRLQGLIWQAVLKSQQLSVIWEAPDIDLVESINQLKEAGLALPDLLLLDVKLENFNPYAFCRWCREEHPSVKIVLTNDSQKEIMSSERQWAVYQGAADFLPGFQRENLVSSVAFSVKRLLDILDSHPLDNGALISVLLAMKRQLEARSVGQPEFKPLNKKSAKMVSPPVDFREAQRLEANGGVVVASSGEGATRVEGEASHSANQPSSMAQLGHLPGDEPPPVRRYRGLSY